MVDVSMFSSLERISVWETIITLGLQLAQIVNIINLFGTIVPMPFTRLDNFTNN